MTGSQRCNQRGGLCVWWGVFILSRRHLPATLGSPFAAAFGPTFLAALAFATFGVTILAILSYENEPIAVAFQHSLTGTPVRHHTGVTPVTYRRIVECVDSGLCLRGGFELNDAATLWSKREGGSPLPLRW